jgi:hypothetical protein
MTPASKTGLAPNHHRTRSQVAENVSPQKMERVQAFADGGTSDRSQIPTAPNEQSIRRQPTGIPRTAPMINAKGRTSKQAIIPKSMTQTFLI